MRKSTPNSFAVSSFRFIKLNDAGSFPIITTAKIFFGIGSAFSFSVNSFAIATPSSFCIVVIIALLKDFDKVIT